jgi:hypothetical protein
MFRNLLFRNVYRSIGSTIFIFQLAASFAHANLLRNPSFEDIPTPAFGQGILPSEWLQLGPPPGVDTYSNDGSYGLFPQSFNNFPGVTAFDGIRWVVGWSLIPERFGQILTIPLTPGITYELSAYLRQAKRSDLAHPGTYEVSLAANTSLSGTVVLGQFSPLISNQDAWEKRTLTFIAPDGAATLPVLVFTPIGSSSGTSYPGLDLLSLNVIASDGDGIPNEEDNCPDDVNVDQLDTDADGEGDVCDLDADEDGVLNASDNCPLEANSDQADHDFDTFGDICDLDDDNDTVNDTKDNCPFDANPTQADRDGDGFGDVCDTDPDGDDIAAGDNCPLVPNADQTDIDRDGTGDACDGDDDNDGVEDEEDNCPITSNPFQEDLDEDGIGNACDEDIDGDGVTNVPGNDNCPTIKNSGQDNTDSDSQGDACDDDDDNDGIDDPVDNCALISNPDQADSNGDGIGDVCDGDIDGDTMKNVLDNCPVVPNTDQRDFDSDGQGDACDSDIDDDGAVNSADVCGFTPLTAVVDPTTGCSIAQLCPCEGPRGTTGRWRNHGQYVSCIARSAGSFVEQELITAAEKDALVSQAAQSTCGRE